MTASFLVVAAVAGLLWASPWSDGATPPTQAAPAPRPAVSGPPSLTSPADLWAAIGGEPAPTTTLPPAEPPPDGRGGVTAGPGGAATTAESAATAPLPSEPPEAPAVNPARAAAEAGPAPEVRLPPSPRSVTANPAAAELLALAGANLVDPDTATIEGSTGYWKPWFNAVLSQAGPDASSGNQSMRVQITALHGWGLEMDIWPGFAAAPGPHVISLAGATEFGSVDAATMIVNWHNDGVLLGTSTLTLSLNETWQRTAAVVTAPVGTTRFRIDIKNRSGGPGDTVLLDDIVVAPVAP